MALLGQVPADADIYPVAQKAIYSLFKAFGYQLRLATKRRDRKFTLKSIAPDVLVLLPHLL